MKEESIQQVKQRFGIIGNDATLNRAIDVAMQVAPTDLSVLITGESGGEVRSVRGRQRHLPHRLPQPSQ